MSVVPNLSRDCKPELRRRDDILKIVDVHDGRDRSTGSSKEIENTAASFRQVRRVRRNTDFPQRERCRHLIYAALSLNSGIFSSGDKEK